MFRARPDNYADITDKLHANDVEKTIYIMSHNLLNIKEYFAKTYNYSEIIDIWKLFVKYTILS